MDTRTSCDALFTAIDRADIDVVRSLIQGSNLDLSAVNSDGQTPIHAAITSGRRDVAMLVMEHPHCSVNALDRHGYTPLMLAVERSEWRLAKALLDRDATINVGWIGVETETIKTANLHALLFMGAKGDVRAAHRSALKIGLTSFEALFSVRHTALRNACERRDVIDIIALMNDGVDASFVLMRLLDKPSSLSVVRGAAVRHLIASGADLPAALAYAMAANSPSAVRALLMLGPTQDIIGEMALMNAARELDIAEMSLLVASGVKGEATLATVADNENEDAVKLMLRDPRINARLDVVPVLMGLAVDGSHRAVKLLIDLGVSPVTALSELMRLGHRNAAKMLLRLGVDGAALMRSLAAGCADRPQQIDVLRALIEVGVDPAPVLCEMARGCKEMTAAKMLVLAGAEIYDAVEYVASADRDELEETLLEVGRDILRTREQMFSAGDDGAGLAATLIAAKDYVASPKGDVYQMIEQVMAKNDHSESHHFAALLHALGRVDWNAITDLVDRNPLAASEVFLLLSKFEDCLPLARVLVAAGVGMLPTMVDSMSNGDLDRLSFLLRAGCPEGVLLAKMLERHGGAALAKAVIQRESINVFKTVEYVVQHGGQARLRHFIPALTDGQQDLITALAQDNRKLADALIKENVDTRKTLVAAILTGEIDAAKRLMTMGVDIAGALAQALAGKHEEVAQILLSWGADPSLALADEVAVRDPEVAAQLAALMDG